MASSQPEARSHPLTSPPEESLPSKAMKPPVILVVDWEQDLPVTMKYIQGDNELDFKTVYTSIKGLCDHPGMGRLEVHTQGAAAVLANFKQCDPEFLDTFWNCFANLLDYFADFVSADTADMQAVWFHLLDELREAASMLLHHYWVPQPPSCTHAEIFSTHYGQALMTLSDVITPGKPGVPGNLAGPEVSLMARMNMNPGGFKSGLKAWQQFFYKECPGFEVPVAERIYSGDNRRVADPTTSEQLIPAAGLAIIQRHTERQRKLAKAVALASGDQTEVAAALAMFDQKSIQIGRPSTYVSLDGRQSVVQPMYPSNESLKTPVRIPGNFDPDFEVPNPILPWVNNQIGVYTGSEEYRHPNGDDKFHMLSLRQSTSSEELPGQPECLRGKFSGLFDNWTEEELSTAPSQRNVSITIT